MQNISDTYKRLVSRNGRTFRTKVICTFSDNTQVTFTDDDILEKGLKLKSATSNENNFSIGCAVINELSLDIDNQKRQLHAANFNGAVFDVHIGLVTAQKWDATLQIEWLRKGLYTAENVVEKEKYISITAYDFMSKFDIEYVPAETTATLSSILNRVCVQCGVTNGALTDFPNADFEVVDSSDYISPQTTCRDIVSYIAQLACSFAHIDNLGYLKFGWYQPNGRSIDERQKLSSPIEITGIQAVDTADTVRLLGEEGYLISIEDNPLLQVREFNPIASAVFADRIVGLQITPFECDILSDPSIEAGDIVTVYDLDGNAYTTPITYVNFCIDSKMTIACDAETVSENQRAGGVNTAIIAVAQREAKRQVNMYNRISQIAANAMGYYETLKTQDDGSVIAYMHDKPALNESITVWKKTADGIFISYDGGQTYTHGIDREANAAVRTVSANGISVTNEQGTFTTNILPGYFQLLISGNTALDASANGGINIYNGNLTIYKGGSTSSEKAIYLDNDGNMIFTGLLGQPNGVTYASIGANSLGNVGFYIYRTDIDAYVMSGGVRQPYLQAWVNTDTETCITAPKGLSFIIEPLGRSSGDTALYLGRSKRVCYGAWDFNQDQTFTHNIQSKSAFILYNGTAKAFSIYRTTNNNICLNSDSGKDIIFAIDNSTKARITSTGGNLYGTWYGTSNQAVTSDVNKKHDIEPLSTAYSDLFDALNPVRYKFNDGTSDRYHTGLIAQQVEQAVTSTGSTSADFGGYLIDSDNNYYLRYEEFIALLISEVQKLKSRVKFLENQMFNNSQETE